MGFLSRINDPQNFRPIGHRIVHNYKAAAIILLNAIVLLACLELSARFVTKIWKVPRRTPEQREKMPKTKTSYYLSQDWANAYWKEFKLSRTQRYHPYVTWRRAPFKGKFINVDRQGVRLTPGAECSGKAYRVFAFGGSTMWGTGSPDWGTIPAYLQAGFKSRRDGPVCVTNFGESGFVSTQGVIQLMLELQSGNVPDSVIFYDGVNDVYAAYQSGRPVHQNLDRIAARLETHKRSPSIVEWIETSYSFSLFKRLTDTPGPKSGNSPKVVTYKTMGIDPATLSDAVTQVYLRNYKIVNGLAKEYGFNFFFFWQPVIAMGEKPLTGEEQKIKLKIDPALVELYEPAYRSIQRAVDKYEKLHYMAEIFNDYNSEIWIDPHHVTPVGNRIIAQKMLEVVGRDRARKTGTGR
jgi:hypothetical protein